MESPQGVAMESPQGVAREAPRNIFKNQCSIDVHIDVLRVFGREQWLTL